MRATISGGSWKTMSARAFAHGMSTWPCIILLSYVVGLQPQWSKEGIIVLAPKIVVSKVDADWCGIQVRWCKKGDQWHLEVNFSQETQVELVSPFPPKTIAEMFINGKKIPAIKEVYRLGPDRQLKVKVKLKQLF